MSSECDVVLIGAGIMSATLGTLLRKLEPNLRIVTFERLDTAAAESSDAWNNAGTGHSGFCELNYTPRAKDGSVDCSKAVKIAAQFNESLELWNSLAATGELPELATFLRTVPHLSFVTGEHDSEFLRTRAEGLKRSSLFEGLEFTQDAARIGDWVPLIMEGRDPKQTVAATRMARGNDVNFGALTRAMFDSLSKQPNGAVHMHHEVRGLHRDGARWRIDVKDLSNGHERSVNAKFVFIGAGGYSLSLLEQSGVPEAKGYGAFPVSGQWLRCTNRAVVERHHAKVYGQAEVGAPPMSVPHLDTRWIDGKQELLFGPYAGFTTRFLKQGSWMDLLGSIGIHNAATMMSAGLANVDLTRYLVGQAMLSEEAREALLRRYYPAANGDDWEVQVAGLRVQIIKNDGKGGGELKFGTEVVTSADGSIAALLGASPGASTAVSIMLELLARCFPEKWKAAPWRSTMARLIPTRS